MKVRCKDCLRGFAGSSAKITASPACPNCGKCDDWWQQIDSPAGDSRPLTATPGSSGNPPSIVSAALEPSATSWAERLDSNPALKRKVAVWATLSVIVVIAVVVGSILLYDNRHSTAETEERRARSNPSPTQPTPQANPQSGKGTGEFWLIAALVAAVIVPFALWILSVFSSTNGPRDRSRHDSSNPLGALFDGIVFLVCLFTPPVGWIFLYLRDLEKQQHRQIEAAADAFDELEMRERRREHEYYEMRAKLSRLENQNDWRE